MPDVLSLTLEADLNNDGVFEEDWSQYLLGVDTGIERDSAIDAFGPRTAKFTMDNADSRFSPRNTGSPYSPNLKDGKRVRLSAQVTAVAAKNYLPNPSVERDLDNWTLISSTLTRDNEGRYGRWGCLVTVAGAPATYGVQIASPGSGPAGGGADYEASVWVKGDTGSTGETGKLTARASGGTGADGESNVTFTFRAGWQRVNTSVDNADGSHTQFELDVEQTTGINAGDKFHVDAAQVDDGTSLGLYLDGDQPEATWDGLAHASSSQRAANPTITVFTGELRDFRMSRSNLIGVAELEATGFRENLARTVVRAGPFITGGSVRTREAAYRVLDIAESTIAERVLGLQGEAVIDGARRYDGDSAGWAAVNGTIDTQKATRGIEGENTVRNLPESGSPFLCAMSYDVTARVTAGKTYHFSAFARVWSNVQEGNVARIRVDVDGTPLAGEATVTIGNEVNQKHGYVSHTVTLPGSFTTVKILFDCTGFNANTESVLWSGIHVAPAFASGRVIGTPTFVGGAEDAPFPVEESSAATVDDVAGTSHAVTLPSGLEAGNLVILFINRDGNPQVPENWNHLRQGGDLEVLYKVADGTEGSTITIRFNTSKPLVATTHRISGAAPWYTRELGIADDIATGSGAPPNPPSVSPQPFGETRNYLSLVAGITDETSDNITAAPPGYSGFLRANGSTMDLATAYKEVAGSTEDAGAFTGDNTTWSAITIMISPDQESRWLTKHEYYDAFDEPVGALLEEMAKSVGGWFYDARDGSITFDDYSTRDPAIIPHATMRLSDEPDAGLPYKVTDVRVPTSSFAGSVKVSSLGEVNTSVGRPDSAVVWALELESRETLQPDEVRVYKAEHVSDNNRGEVIARLPTLEIATASGMAESRLECYGTASVVTLTANAGGSPSTFDVLKINAKPAVNRARTNQSFVQTGLGIDGEPLDPILELEMPAQGDRTDAMKALMRWAYDKYNPGPARITASIEGLSAERLLDVFSRDVGEPVWLSHNQGPGHFGLDALFFCEGIRLSWAKGAAARLEMQLEEAAE